MERVPRVVLRLLVVLNGVSFIPRCVVWHWVEHIAVPAHHHHVLHPLFGEPWGGVGLFDAQLALVVPTPWVKLGTGRVGLLCAEHH